MSLIEQASKRLEELRRAGAAPVDEAARDADALPTPEAVVRALESRKDQQPDIWSAAGAAASTQAVRAAAAIAEPPLAEIAAKSNAGRTSRLVTIDLERLKARGYVSPDAPTTQVADEFRVIKRPIIRNAQGRGGAKVRNGNLVMVTSALPAEGKTFTAVNLAMSIAMEYDNTVLLVDGDVAHPSVPRLFGVPDSPGLLDLLTNDKLDVADVLLRTNIEKLSLMQAGSAHRRATELLASEQMASLLRELASRYPDRIIVFDSPPLLATTEARVMASHMGQIVMVVAADSTSQNVVNQALSTIESCEVVLMMLNKASPKVAGIYGYYGDDGSR
jgi:exopolysaccharide/PEP-CTERM locus tyrosine autokinase